MSTSQTNNEALEWALRAAAFVRSQAGGPSKKEIASMRKVVSDALGIGATADQAWQTAPELAEIEAAANALSKSQRSHALALLWGALAAKARRSDAEDAAFALLSARLHIKRNEKASIQSEGESTLAALRQNAAVKDMPAYFHELLGGASSPDGRKRFGRLDPAIFEHPLDREARAALKRIPGFDRVLKALLESGAVRMQAMNMLANAIEVSPKQYPELHGLFLDCVNVLDIRPVPRLYISAGGRNAMTFGVGESVHIVIYSGLISSMSEDELRFVIGHELGHVAADAVLYRNMAVLLANLADRLGRSMFGIGSLLTVGLRYGLLEWFRKAEYSADRAGLLVSQRDPEIAVSAMMKLAGAPIDYKEKANAKAFIQQAKNFQYEGRDAVNKLIQILLTMGRSHPLTVLRAKELIDWVESGGYQKAMSAAR